jgi:general secretion pathway protein D
MSRNGFALMPFVATVPLLVASAFAQEAPKPETVPAPKPAEAKPSEPPRSVEFLSTDSIRKADGLVVHFYKVNYVDAKLLVAELEKWKAAPNATFTADGPTVVPVGKAAAPGLAAVPGLPFQNTLRIQDTEENWPVLKRVLDIVDAPQLQVYVEAKIVEVAWSDELHIGTKSSYVRTVGDTFFQSAELSFPNRLDAVNGFSAAFQESTKYATFDYVIDLAAAGAKTNVISKPGVFASQGETATIRVGESEPIVQQSLAGNNVTATTIFKDTGLSLEVQPMLIGRDAVRARISAELSRVSSFRVTATSSDLQVVNPVISTRKTETVLTVPDGETLTIAGLDQDFERDENVGIPLLMDIPVIGVLFGSKGTRKEHTELVFFLTLSIRAPGEARVIKPPVEKARTGE